MGSLPLALGKLGIEVVLVMPRYRGLKHGIEKLASKVRIYFVENEAFFNRAHLYGNERGDYPDNLKRFSFFCQEALALAKRIHFKADVIHAHDWQTALLPVLVRTKFANDPFFAKTKTLLTIHNAAYQGHFPRSMVSDLGIDEQLFSVDAFEFFGRINLLKAGIVFADAVNTVSPTYAKEIQAKHGFWLEGVLKKMTPAVRGILNGIDTDLWNPAKDRWIRERYSEKDLEAKKANKLDLQARCGLVQDPDIPLFAMVSRLAEQKGMDLLAEAADSFLSKRVQFVLLGDGDSVYKTTFRNIAARHAENTAAFFDFNVEQAHRIYAGADFFLMPSHYEPCGLGQMISLRYGTIPVVRRTGGLADTIVDADQHAGKGNGFIFADRSSNQLLKAIDRARSIYQDKRRLFALQKRAMRCDFSWQKSAKDYQQFYREILKWSSSD